MEVWKRATEEAKVHIGLYCLLRRINYVYWIQQNSKNGNQIVNSCLIIVYPPLFFVSQILICFGWIKGLRHFPCLSYLIVCIWSWGDWRKWSKKQKYVGLSEVCWINTSWWWWSINFHEWKCSMSQKTKHRLRCIILPHVASLGNQTDKKTDGFFFKCSGICYCKNLQNGT